MVLFDLNDPIKAVLTPVSYEMVRITTGIFIAFDNFKIETEKAKKYCSLINGSTEVRWRGPKRLVLSCEPQGE